MQATEADVAVEPESQCLTITGRGTFAELALETKTYHVIPAEALGSDLKRQRNDVLVETDQPAAQSQRQGRLMEKVGATGGTAFCCIDGPVQWVEWTFAVPENGHYELFLRTASVYTSILRELAIDGKPFPQEGSAVRMPGTGGWCRTTNDWQWFGVNDTSGKPATVELTAGTHRLKLEFVEGSQNIDCFVLRPIETPKP